MRMALSNRLRCLAGDIHETDSLTQEDIVLLNDKAPVVLQAVKSNLDSKKKPFEELSDEEIRILLSFVIYKRQNITTTCADNPNDEDAAKVLHGKVYPMDGTEAENSKMAKELEEELKKQLSKAGLDIK